MIHEPVLLNEVIEKLDLKQGQVVVDGTFGGGGHAQALLEKIQPDGVLLGIDLDGELLEQAREKYKSSSFSGSLILANGNYADIVNIATENGIHEADAVLLDLGMSSWHLDESQRGFSFTRDEPLDMRYQRMNIVGESKTAAAIVNRYPENKLADIIYEYGEERLSRKIARAIVQAREKKRIETTGELIEIIGSAVPGWYKHGKIHFATRTFQALRIEVNGELDNLKHGLPAAFNILKRGGMLAVISFHSLEDRIVKLFGREQIKNETGEFINKKPIIAGAGENESNPRARSAKLRIIKKMI
ncbi:MAG: 16S rRNA (cytosine1402-N4)-methyltransferase [Parcubacteria group bacterium Licking1014_17]|nr:MAG: 16S rRNA (cytosine1402-N4)-methyltransferase [Parcubacteria group bacterium Licking1014_17]